MILDGGCGCKAYDDDDDDDDDGCVSGDGGYDSNCGGAYIDPYDPYIKTIYEFGTVRWIFFYYPIGKGCATKSNSTPLVVHLGKCFLGEKKKKKLRYLDPHDVQIKPV